ncbi:MAG TPA: histidine kinase [Terriglobales bacterium]|nr:histidine kinase [Terriglobales bacterium]
MSPGEVRRVERWLGSARVFLAVSALVAIWMDPGTIHYSIWALGLLAFYIAQGMIIIIFLRRRQQSTPSFRVLVHSADIIWPALISLFAIGESNTFFLFFVFVLAAAAYRWGLWETLGTALAEVGLLWTESFALRWGFFPAIYGFFFHLHWPRLLAWLYAFLFRHHWPPVQFDATYFEPKALFMRSVYLVVLGLLLGYLAEQQKQLRAEKVFINRTLGKARVETGVSGTLQEIAGELLSTYRAKHLLIASQEVDSHRVFVAELSDPKQGASFQWLESSPKDPATYLQKSQALACYIERSKRNGSGHFSVLALDESGTRLQNPSTEFLDAFAKVHQFHSALVVSFAFGREWLGRIFLLDPMLTGETEEELHFLQEWVRQVGPAVYNVLLLRRLRLRAGAVERARFARELHDGAVQSLIAVEMQVDVLRRQSVTRPDVLPAELGRIQALLREEVLKLRELMQQMKTLDVDAKRLLGVIHDTVERFQRETGICAHFISDLVELQMPQPVCREVARIIQEALVNVRKHSQARQVLVRLGVTDGSWKMEIEDDGRGFPFSGRLSQRELDSLGKGPAVIKERVRLLEGELTIESHPGRGSRLEILVPQQKAVLHGQP